MKNGKPMEIEKNTSQSKFYLGKARVTATLRGRTEAGTNIQKTERREKNESTIGSHSVGNLWDWCSLYALSLVTGDQHYKIATTCVKMVGEGYFVDSPRPPRFFLTTGRR